MKATLFLLAFLIGYVASESCSVTSDCIATSCQNGFTLSCIDRTCRCSSAPTGVSCTDKADCEGDHSHGNHDNCHSGGLNWHCVNGMCQCYH